MIKKLNTISKNKIKRKSKENVEMNDFIFSNKLKTELQFLRDNPEKLPCALCFYGEPGTGKTSFAKNLASEFSADVLYYDSNSYKSESKTSNAIVKEIRSMCNSMNLFDDEKKPFMRVFIIDEFHDLSPIAQNNYKVLVEDIRERDMIFIFILNTERNSKKSSYENRVTPAMRSRFHAINFDIHKDQVDEVCKLAKNKYPNLPKKIIHKFVSDSDMRQLSSKAKMLS